MFPNTEAIVAQIVTLLHHYHYHAVISQQPIHRT